MTVDVLGRCSQKNDGCHYCGGTHSTVCDKIGRIEYDEEGVVLAVCMREPVPFSVDSEDAGVSGSYEDVRRWQREKLQ